MSTVSLEKLINLLYIASNELNKGSKQKPTNIKLNCDSLNLTYMFINKYMTLIIFLFINLNQLIIK